MSEPQKDTLSKKAIDLNAGDILSVGATVTKGAVLIDPIGENKMVCLTLTYHDSGKERVAVWNKNTKISVLKKSNPVP